MVVNFELNGQFFMGLNGGNNFKFNEAVSFVIPCKDQNEIDHYWNSLISDGGSEGNCGWCRDKFGISWQVVPTILGELMSNPNNGQRVMQALIKMKKFEIETLKNAQTWKKLEITRIFWASVEEIWKMWTEYEYVK